MAIQLNTNPVFLDPELAEILEYQRNINIGGGTNLAGQGGGGLLNRLRNQVQETDPYAYGSYVIPASDPTYSSGFNYARTIAGGMPFEDVVAPGMSFSPDQPMGYTQADLTPRFVGEGPAPVMPVAPTQGTPLTIEDQMPYAPVGTPTPTPFMGIPDYIKNLDFSNLPRFEDIRDIRGVGDIRPSLFDIDVEEILKDIDTEKFADIDFSNIDIPSVAPAMPELPDFSNRGESVATSFMPGGDSITDFLANQGVATDRESLIGKTLFGQTITPESFGGEETAKSSFLSAVPRPDLPIPNISGPFGFMNKPTPAPVIPQVPVQEPMNFTKLPQMPVIPNIPVMPELPVMPQPIVQQPIQPMNFTRLSNLPVSNFVQPSVEDIVSPISRGRTLPPTPRGLFSL